jgi:hypothetical protein
MEISGYPEAVTVDQADQTADATLAFLDTCKPLLVHMELLRRAYTVYGTNTDESAKLMKALKARYMAEPENAEKYFDYGYAQLVMTADKNGLFFLRKANDKLANPYTSLAYGITQIDTDLAFENQLGSDLTPRKMDAIYKIKDALQYNKEDVMPGIWPSYIHILESIKSYSAYDSFRNEDMSTLYVPFGNADLSKTPDASNAFLSLESTAKNPEIQNPASAPVPVVAAPAQTCSFANPPDWSKLYVAKSMDLLSNGQNYSINFFNIETGKPYKVVVMDPQNNVVGEFSSYKAPYIMEDVDNDGKFELVIRQYEKDPYHPVYVYRWNGNCYGEDQQISTYFK